MSNFIETQKAFRFNVDVIKSKGDIEGDFFVEGYASTSDLDRQGDIVIQAALNDAATQLKEINNTVFFGHSYTLEDSVGRIVDAHVDDIGLKVEIYVSKWAKELRMKLKEQIINKFSIGGRVLKDKELTREEALEEGLITEKDPFDMIKVILKMELFEVSFVGVPANPHAQVVGTFAKALKDLYEGGDRMEDLKKQEVKQIEKMESEETSEETQKVEEIVKEEEQEKTVEEKVEETPANETVEEKVEEPLSEEKTEEEVKELVNEETTKEEEIEISEDEVEKEEEVEDDASIVLDALNAFSDKIDKAMKEIEALKDIMTSFEKKVKLIEVHEEKKSLVKTEDPIEEKIEEKSEEQDKPDIDAEFFKYVTGRK